MRGTSQGGFAGVPNALNLELCCSVFKADLAVASWRGRVCVALQLEPEPESPLPPSPLRLACCARTRAVGVLCYTAVITRARAPPPSPLRLACCARGRVVGVLRCTAVRARDRPPPRLH